MTLCYYCRTPIDGEPTPGWHDEPYCRGCAPVSIRGERV